ncbi:SAUR-like auxin-responsive protein family [Actinidia rufa]|uniref:SAUR-like auxin-responsive protein family n=1 Tax=Actinidia rufa TaxID=165716 RepID=A0A7J0EJV4_9ERIC|nr:SAUR-like auxin-responsive protein family [Actinidia rufa]
MSACSKIRHIVRLRQMLRRWRKKASAAFCRAPSDVRALRTRGDLCGDQLQAIRGARVVPEPPHLQEALGPGRGRVRLLQHRPISHSLRRVRFRRGAPVVGPARVQYFGSVHPFRGPPKVLPCGLPEPFGLLARISAPPAWAHP